MTIILDVSDSGAKIQFSQGKRFRRAHISGFFGDPWLDGFVVGASPTEFKFKCFVDDDERVWRRNATREELRTTWPMCPMRPHQETPPPSYLEID